MTKKPIINAGSASLYIILIATFMNNGEKLTGNVDGVIVPIAMLSLFVLSASLMGYIFFYYPARLYFDGERKEAVNLFLKTILYFAIITIALFVTIFMIAL